jgi:hypothetical protein
MNSPQDSIFSLPSSILPATDCGNGLQKKVDRSSEIGFARCLRYGDKAEEIPGELLDG